MGIKTAVAGITPSAGALTQAQVIGADLKGLLSEIQLKTQELTALMNFINTDILTPGGDTSNATTISTQITALA